MKVDLEKRFKFLRYEAPGESGVTFQEIDGLARPVGGVCFCPGQTFGGKAMEEYHHGWLCTPPDSAGRAMAHPASSEEEAAYAERMTFLAESSAKKLRRRIEDRLRKGGLFVALRYSEGNEGIFKDS